MPFVVTKFDTLTRTDSIFVVTNNMWKALENEPRSYIRIEDSAYHKKLRQINTYDNEFRVVEEKFFNYEDDHQNKVYLTGQFQYEYDAFGNMIKKTFSKKGKPYSYHFFENGRMIREEKAGSSEYTVYTKNQKQERKTTKISYDKILEYKGHYITGLFYLDKLGNVDKEIKPRIVNFRYKFDKQKNWIEIVKNVDGKDLYKWVRKIEYY